MEFLGFLLSFQGLAPLPERVEAIRKFPRPNSIRQLRSFLGLINFYRKFIPRAAETLAPLNYLLK
ncbi:uncharacterized protein B4U79_04943, partial [Dinothrombium tinctorium]